MILPLPLILVIMTGRLIVMQTILPPLKPQMTRNTSVWIPMTGTDFCVRLCLSMWYGFCHALPVILVCLFSVLHFFGRNFGRSCCLAICVPPEYK